MQASTITILSQASNRSGVGLPFTLDPSYMSRCNIVALPLTLKSMYLKAKEELWKLKYISPCKKNKTLMFKKASKRNQNPSRYYNSCN
jgi:hypothetical protein